MASRLRAGLGILVVFHIAGLSYERTLDTHHDSIAIEIDLIKVFKVSTKNRSRSCKILEFRGKIAPYTSVSSISSLTIKKRTIRNVH